MYATLNISVLLFISNCICLKAENSKFAKKCRSKGGLFKCCMTSKRLDKNEDVRQTLRNLSLIQWRPETEGCGKKWSGEWKCNICATTHFCTIKVDFCEISPETHSETLFG